VVDTRHELTDARSDLSGHISQSATAHQVERDRLDALTAQVQQTLNTLQADQGRLDALSAQVQQGLSEREADQGRLDALSAQVQRGLSEREADQSRLREILLSIVDREHSQRERLRELRASDAYLEAFVETEPLVSVVIPTYDRAVLLRERSICSVLAQTYQHFEVIVVGDAAPDAVRVAVESFGDDRIRYINLPYRGPYPDDPVTRWLVAGVPPYNEGVRIARGRWIAPLDDDDAFRPEHLEHLLETAQRKRLELVYGRILKRFPSGESESLGRFPPAPDQFGLQASLYHAGLRDIFELQLTDSLFDLPYDWGFCQRLIRAGARIQMVDEISVDYYPSQIWEAQDNAPPAMPPEWEFVAEGWERARRADQLCSRGWDVEDVARAYVEHWPEFNAAISDRQPFAVAHEVPPGAEMSNTSLVAHNTAMTLAYVVAAAAPTAGTMSVLDWGGGLGYQHSIARNALPHIQFDWHTRELPAVCREGKRASPLISFHDDDHCLEGRYDLVVASSSLQYAEDWRALLHQLAHATRGNLFLTRVPYVQSAPSFVVLQRAQAYGYATEYLGWVFNRSELLDVAAAGGLQLVREFFLQDALHISGAPESPCHGAFLFTPGPAIPER